MDSSYLGELKKILGHSEKTKLTLPRVFIGGRYTNAELGAGSLTKEKKCSFSYILSARFVRVLINSEIQFS